MAAVPEGDPLTRRATVRLADLADRPVVLCSTAATTTGLWPDGERPRAFEVANVDEWLTVIATGEARASRPRGRNTATLTPVSGTFPRRRASRHGPAGLAAHPGHPATLPFSEHLRDMTAGDPP